MLSSIGPTQELQLLLDAIDAESPVGPFVDSENRFLVSTLPVETARQVASGLAVIAQGFGPTASPQSAQRGAEDAIPQAASRLQQEIQSVSV